MALSTKQLSELANVLDFLTVEEKAEVDEILFKETPLWVPLPGPQTEAAESQADILFYGGQAGGGKTDLILGLAATQHHRSIIFRRQSTQLLGLQDRLFDEIINSRDGFNSQKNVWRHPDRQIEFGSCNNVGDEQAYQGRPHDLKAFDEICHFMESQFRFLCGWTRSTKQGQRQRVVCAGNPPTDSNGEWVIQFFGPWLDPKHPDPARPGELRWYAVIDGKDTPVPDGKSFQHDGETITPKSRTFIPSSIDDNPFLLSTGYKSTLQALPEPLRSQMLKGDFRAGRQDDIWQLIPTAWVDEAMERWSEAGKQGQMDSLGCDVARGGRDNTVIAPRYGNWYAPLHRFPGMETPNGQSTASLIVSVMRDRVPIHVDIIGVGGSVYDHLEENGIQVIAVNGAEKAPEGSTDKTGRLKFRNMRAYLYWRFREMLEPEKGENLALPPDPKLKADLCAPRWKMTPQGIQVEAKEDIISRIARSPDDGDAVVYASIQTPKAKAKSGSDWRKNLPTARGSWRVR